MKNTGTLTNTGWTVQWSWPTGNQKILSYTNANVSQSGKAVTATNLASNASGPPGASTQFMIAGQGSPAIPTPTLTCIQH